jgi:NADPH:quinone reductase-like Zn-dependent oxidoreductase
MRAVVLTKHGPPEALPVQTRPDPAPPAPDEVTIKVEAAGIAFAGVATRLGVYPGAEAAQCAGMGHCGHRGHRGA